MKSVILTVIILLSLNSRAAVPNGDPAILKEIWYFSAINLPKAWDIVSEVKDFKIAVVDMDFSLQHEDLKNIFDMNLSKDFSGHNFGVFTEWSDPTEHGTLVAGLLGADGINSYGSSGVVKNSSIIAINIAPVGAEVDIAEALRYAVDSGAKVINGSFGYPSSVPPDVYSKLKDAIKYAQEKDVILVFSSGNDGRRDNDANPFYPASFTVEFDNVVSVGASNIKDERSFISSYGKRHVDLFAPGDDIIGGSKPGLYRKNHGTSEAAPITAGVVALMRQANPKLKAKDIKRLLLDSTDKKESLNKICVSGGRLNAYRAVLAARLAK